MSTALPLPHAMTLHDWADQVVFSLDSYGSFPKLMDEQLWQDWGANLLLNVGLSSKGIPSPYGFAEWKPWAQRLCEVLS